jgi:hypothetical protein
MITFNYQFIYILNYFNYYSSTMINVIYITVKKIRIFLINFLLHFIMNFMFLKILIFIKFINSIYFY